MENKQMASSRRRIDAKLPTPRETHGRIPSPSHSVCSSIDSASIPSENEDSGEYPSDDNDSFQEFNDYMDDYVQRELDQQMQRQLDLQMDEQNQRIDDLIQQKLDDAMDVHSKLLQKEIIGDSVENELDVLLKNMNLIPCSQNETEDKATVKTTVSDIDRALHRVLDRYGGELS